MVFKLVENQSEWDGFLKSQNHSQFLQSWAWGEFQKAYGRRVWRVGIFENGRQAGAAQLGEYYLGLGMGYLYCPKGPLYHDFASHSTLPRAGSVKQSPSLSNGIAASLRSSQYRVMPYDIASEAPACHRLAEGMAGRKQSRGFLDELVQFIKKHIANYGHLFIKIEPDLSSRAQTPSVAGEAIPPNLRRVPSIQPTHTLVLNLSLTEEELLAAMHQKTRYNIHLAERKGLDNVVLKHPEEGEEFFSHFWRLLQETARRDKIRLHPKRYQKMMLKVVPHNLFSVFYQSQLLAAGFFIGFGDTFTYVHGASSSAQRELMAPYFLHWQAIKFAKQAGYRYYDFGGVNPEDKNDFDYRSRCEGITRFKRGFGGEIFSSSGAFEAPLSERGYKIYRAIKKIKSMLP